MEKPSTLEFDYDEQHTSEGLDYDSPEEKHEALGDELSVAASSSSNDYEGALPDAEGALPDAEGSPDGIFWGILAAFCFLAGLSIGLVLYFKSGFALTVADWLRRCCPKVSRGTPQDPVLLTVVDRKSKDSVENDGADQNSEGSSSDDDRESKSGEKCKDCTKVKFQVGEGECDCEGASADRGKGAEGKQGGGETTAAAIEDNKDNEEVKGEKEANEDDKKSNSSSSSSSSSENEGNKDDEERSVRHRKKATSEATEEGGTVPESDDKGDGEHKE